MEARIEEIVAENLAIKEFIADRDASECSTVVRRASFGSSPASYCRMPTTLLTKRQPQPSYCVQPVCGDIFEACVRMGIKAPRPNVAAFFARRLIEVDHTMSTATREQRTGVAR